MLSVEGSVTTHEERNVESNFPSICSSSQDVMSWMNDKRCLTLYLVHPGKQIDVQNGQNWPECTDCALNTGIINVQI